MYGQLSREEAERLYRQRSDELFLRRAFDAEHYKQADAAGERWITLGGGEGERRGTHVKIDGDGNIVGGPKPLEGKNLGELGSKKAEHPADDFKLTSPKNKEHVPKQTQQPAFDKHAAPVPRAAAVGGLEGHGIKTLSDGRKVGLTFLTAADLAVDPGRFQYKIDGVDAHGVSAKLKDVETVNPNFLGLTLAWHDPKDGKTYVVNGHHRHELLTRLGYTGPIPVSLIDAKDESDARALGALTNIAEGNGTSLDAAKFLKEAGEEAETLLIKNGVSLKGQIADDGLALSNLQNDIFRLVVNKQLDREYATIMGRTLSDPKQQKEMLHDLRIMEQRGYDLNKNRVQALADKFSVSDQLVEQQTDLFGTEEIERSLRPERVILEDIVKREIGKEVRTFTEVSRKGREGLLEEAGNTIDQDTNRRRAQESQELYQTFVRETNYKGPINDLANEFARRLAANPKQAKSIGNEFALRFRAEILQNDQGTGRPAVGGSDATTGAGSRVGPETARADGTATSGSENPGLEPYRRVASAVKLLRYGRAIHRLRDRGARKQRITATILRYEAKFHYPKQSDTPGRYIDIDCFEGHCQSRKVYGADAAFDESEHPRDEDGKFAGGSGGIAKLNRAEMPQIAGPDKQEFLDWLQSLYGISAQPDSPRASDLKPTQADLSESKVAAMVKTMRTDGVRPGSPVLASSDGYILDGHHRWQAQLEVDPDSEFPVIRVGAGIDELVNLAKKFPKSFTAGVDEAAGARKYQRIAERLRYWREAEHPRDESGKFSGDGGGAAVATKPKAKSKAAGKKRTSATTSMDWSKVPDKRRSVHQGRFNR